MLVVSFSTPLSGDVTEIQAWFDDNPTFVVKHILAIGAVIYIFYTDPT